MAKTPDQTIDPGDEKVIEHVAEVTAPTPPGEQPVVQSPVTPSGKPVEEQVRKEWDNNRDGGLPTFLRQQR